MERLSDSAGFSSDLEKAARVEELPKTASMKRFYRIVSGTTMVMARTT